LPSRFVLGGDASFDALPIVQRSSGPSILSLESDRAFGVLLKTIDEIRRSNKTCSVNMIEIISDQRSKR
jgi:hypothetical protein